MADSDQSFTLTIDGKVIKQQELRISEVRYSASMHSLYSINLTLERGSDKKSITPAEFLTKKLKLDINSYKNKKTLSGVITTCKRVMTSAVYNKTGTELLLLRVMPDFPLGSTGHNKIYVNKSTPDIVKDILDSFYKLSMQSKLSKTPSPRKFCLKYWAEDDLRFMQRILSEEGIYFLFDQSQSPSAFTIRDGNNYTDSTLSFTSDTDFPYNSTLDYTTQIKEFTVFDHCPDNPSEDKKVNKQNSETTAKTNLTAELWPYPGPNYDSTSDGTQCLETLLAREKARSSVYHLSLNGQQALPLDLGMKFKFRSDSGATSEFAVIGIDTTVNFKFEMTCEVAVIDSAIPYIPDFYPEPAIPTLPAVVIGSSDNSKEQRYNQNGCVQVRFYWEPTGKSAHDPYWTRVAQLWAGKQYGTFFPPTINSEVAMLFLYGPNRPPVVIGTIHDKEIAYPNQDQHFWTGFITKNEEGKFSHEVIFDDTKDKEKFTLNISKDFESTIQENKTETIKKGTNTHTHEEGDRANTLKKGNETITLEQGNRTTTLKSGGDTLKVSDDLSVSAKNITLSGDQQITIKAGSSKIVLSSSGIEISGTSIKISGTGSLESSAPSIKISASGTLESSAPSIKVAASGMLDLSAGGITQVKGGLVKIN